MGVGAGDGMEQLATSLAHMARDLLAQESVPSTLAAIVDHAVGRIDGCEAASVMVLGGNRELTTVVATSEFARESDRIQAAEGEGPCFDAIVRQQPVYRIAEIGSAESRWARLAPRARSLGIGSMMGFHLFTSHDNLGSLNLYSPRTHAFTHYSEQVGWIFPSHAAVAFASARNDAQLHEAVATRQGIGEAMGIIMNRYRLGEDDAFELLKKTSQDRNIKLRRLARHIVDTGEVPPNTRR